MPLAASLGATSAAGDMSDIRPDILEMIKEEQKVSTQHHVDMLVATPCMLIFICNTRYTCRHAQLQCAYIPKIIEESYTKRSTLNFFFKGWPVYEDCFTVLCTKETDWNLIHSQTK